MWPFRKHLPLVGSGALKGMTDWHSHILPGVDDGVESLNDSLDILQLCEDSGMRRIWLTPHIMEDVPNSTAFLRERFSDLKDAYKGKIELRLGAENMLDNLFEERLNKGDLLPIGDRGKHLLVETSYFSPPMNFPQILKEISGKGFHPVLAHPERYVYMTKRDYTDLASSGVILQMNLFSLTGMYGVAEKRKAEWLLSKGMIGLVGSDTHSLEQIRFGINAERLAAKTVNNLLRAVQTIEP